MSDTDVTQVSYFATTDGEAPIEAPAGVTYVGYRHHVPRGSRGHGGFDIHEWQIRGEVFVTVGKRPEVHNPCERCGGSGQFSYNQLDGTMCYGCNGDGIGKQIQGFDDALRLVKGRERRALAAQRKAIREQHVTALAWNAWRDGRDGLIAALLAQPRDEYSGDYRPGFLGEMASKVASCMVLTEKQEAAVLRTLDQRAARIEAKQAAGHWGVVGKRAEVEVTIRSARDFDGDYGVRYLVIMETADGQTLKTWASGEFGWTARNRLERAEDGRPVTATIKATVKKHDEYNGAPQTEVQRVAVVKWHGEE